MFSTKMAQKSILFALLVIFITSQASAKKCYACYSQIDGDCKTNPRQEKFEEICVMPNTTVFAAMPLNPNPFQDENTESNEFVSRALTFECATVTYTNLRDGEPSLARGCVPKFYKDETLKVLSLAAFIQTDKIRRCNSELCNGY